MTTDRRRTFSRPRAIGALGVLVAGALVGGTIVQGASGHSSARSHHRARAHSSVAPAQAGDTFAVLARPANASDQEDGALVGAAQHDPTLEPSAARVLSSDASGTTWLIPTSDGRLCAGLQPAAQYEALEQQRGLEHLSLGYSCAPVASAEGEGIVVHVYDEILGVVPDGVTSVSTSTGGSPPATRTVVDNTYRFSVPAGFVHGTVTFDRGDGTEVVDQF
jgi:hypothetical protein